jgi:hypothetical protein
MSALTGAINLQFGKSTLCYQDVICSRFMVARICSGVADIAETDAVAE